MAKVEFSITHKCSQGLVLGPCFFFFFFFTAGFSILTFLCSAELSLVSPKEIVHAIIHNAFKSLHSRSAFVPCKLGKRGGRVLQFESYTGGGRE